MSKDTYEDIIDQPYPFKSAHPRMSLQSRAAQFAPFAALTTHSSAIRETARQTEDEVTLSGDERQILDWKLQELLAHLSERPQVHITYFLPDARKKGGSYQEASGALTRILETEGCLELEEGRRIPLDSILSLESDLLDE